MQPNRKKYYNSNFSQILKNNVLFSHEPTCLPSLFLKFQRGGLETRIDAQFIRLVHINNRLRPLIP